MQDLSLSEIQRVITDGIVKNIESEEYFHSEQIVTLATGFEVTSQLQQDVNAISAAQKRIIKELENGRENYVAHNVNLLEDFFQFGQEFKSSIEFQDAFSKGFEKYLQKKAFRHPDYSPDEEDVNEWRLLFNKFGISQELNDQIVVNAIRAECRDLISENEQGYSKGDADVVLALTKTEFLQNKQLILREDVQKDIVAAIVHKFGVHVSSQFLAKIPLTNESLTNEDITEIAKLKFQKETRSVLSPNRVNLAKSLQEKFGLDRSFVIECLRNGISHDVNFGFNYDGIKSAREVFQLSDEEFFQSIADGLVISTRSKEKYHGNLPEQLEHLLENRKKYPDSIPPDDILLTALPLAVRDVLKTADKPNEVIALNKFYRTLDGQAGIFDNKEVQDAYKFAIERWLGAGDVSAAQKICSLLNKDNNPTVSDSTLKDESIGKLVDDIVARYILGESSYDLQYGAIQLHALAPFIDRPVRNEDAKQKLNTIILSAYQKSSSELKEFSQLYSAFHLPEEDRVRLTELCVQTSMHPSKIGSDLVKLNNALNILGEQNSEAVILQRLPKYLDTVKTNFALTGIAEISEFVRDHEEYFEFLATTPDTASQLTPEDMNLIVNIPIGKDMIIAELAKRDGIDLAKIETEEDYRRLFTAVRGNYKEWTDEQNISGPFEAGANIFGYKRMFAYIQRENLSYHDALHAFQSIINFYQTSGLTPDQFYGQILSHVMRDDAVYNAGTAHHQLNEIATTLNTDYTENLELAREFSDLEGVGDLATLFSSPEQVFASWNNLKRYSKLTQLLGEREVLEALHDIKNPKLRTYVTRLAFHRDSKVDIQAAIQFATDPMAFLERDDGHAPPEVHDRKKPSNYIEIPNLDLTAQELVEALVDGKMDPLSAFTPMEVEYTVIIDEAASRPHELLKRALGARAKEGADAIPGEARDPKKLYSEVGHLLKPTGLNVQQYLAGVVLPDTAKSEIEQKLVTILFNEQYGLRKTAVKTQTYVAKIGKKSDPDMVLAGDDTVNCMPFGSGKNTVYTFNPNTAQFVLQVVRPDGKRRTIAQSVITKDIDIKKSIPTVIQQLQEEGGHLVDVLPEDALLRQSAIIACDNVEVSPNFTDQSGVITALYRDFFRQYLGIHAKIQNLRSDCVIVGEGYSDALNELPEIPNTYAPQAPVSYSDATGSEVRTLEMSGKDPYVILESNVTVDELPQIPKEIRPPIEGLESLTFEHALQVAYIEGKAYSSNTSLIQYLHNMENGLIAKDINNAAKGRPNMSLAYRDKAGKMQGYMLAYEGKINDTDVENYASEYTEQPFLYISDIASNVSTGGTNDTGLSLLRGFIQLYKQHYIDAGNAVPIFAQMREETSYRIVQRGLLNRLVRDLGVEFEVEELETYQVGNSTMHPVIIKPIGAK